MKVKCPMCGTKYEGHRCPTCGRITQPEMIHQRHMQIVCGILVAMAFAVLLFGLTPWVVMYIESIKIDRLLGELDQALQGLPWG